MSKQWTFLSLLLCSALAGCSPKAIANFVLPKAPAYPDFTDKQAIVAEAQAISDGLEKHISAWLSGKASAEIPAELLPKGMSLLDAPFELVRAENVRPEEQWLIRKATYQLNFNALSGLYPDPHCTYIVPAAVILPFGHKLIVEGEFPHARFFDLQMSPPLDPNFYYVDKKFGVSEVPLVDADIEPLPGHTNPFLVGANRNASKRSYRVTFEMKLGNGVALEPAYREPLYRKKGNLRYASAIQYQGPLGYQDILLSHKRGKWDDGTLWLRYYAPDKAKGSLGGVALPRLYYQTPAGDKYYVVSKNRAAEDAQFNKTFPAKAGAFVPPKAFSTTSDFGWMRDLDIYHGLIGSIYQLVGKTTAAEKAEGRALVKGITSTGEDVPAPGNAMSSNSRVPYISYLSRGLNMDKDHVLVITGKLPKYPKTIQGEPVMAGGQVRYLSFTFYPALDIFKADDAGIPHASIMDEEMRLNQQGYYTLVYSDEATRPANWNAAGISWQNSGPTGSGGLVVRWLSVHSEWRDAALVPDASNISYGEASWLSTRWNQNLVGRNNQSGLLKQYQPLVHYLKRSTFEKMGPQLAARTTPYWEDAP
ncbi:hypothetical protein [Hymenobacter terrenus]|uniref:hypothetical protein n=1 Tax=Hymenobacter terrenus TaxID=1629124 RepID=UPI0006194075|nr:hypothetical protein [Hymenobacter terrenus]